MADKKLRQTGSEVQHLLDTVQALAPATERADGLMASGDKAKLDSLEGWEPMTNMEILSVVKDIFN